MNDKALELYKQYLINQLGLVFDEEATNSAEYNNKIRKYILFLPPKKEDINTDDTSKETSNSSQKEAEIVPKAVSMEELVADLKEDEVSSEPRFSIDEDLNYCIEHPDGRRIALSNTFVAVNPFKDGVARVKKWGQYNLIDAEGNLLSPSWYDYIYDFQDGIAIVKGDNQYNIISKEGQLLAPRWCAYIERLTKGLYKAKKGITGRGCYSIMDASGEIVIDSLDYIDFFYDGVAKVYNNGKWNYINTDGHLISREWFDDVTIFVDGFAKVKKDILVKSKNADDDSVLSTYNYINTDGNLMLHKWVDSITPIDDTYKCVVDNGKMNVINGEWELLSSVWYDEIRWQETIDLFVVKQNKKYNLMDAQGKLLSKEWYDSIANFKNGFAIVQKDGLSNYINTNGELRLKDWYDFIDKFDNNGFARVRRNGYYNLMDVNGNLLSPIWYDKIHDFHNGFAIVDDHDEYNYINKSGKLISNVWLDVARDFRSDGLAWVEKGRVTYIMDVDGNLILNIWLTEQDFISGGLVKNYPNFINMAGTVTCKKIDMGKYQVKKVFGGYKCDDGVSDFKVKYVPIKKFDFRYTLCFNSDTHELCLHDRMSNQYKQLGNYSDIVYDDHFIVDNKHRKIYLIYVDTFIDVTEYYLANLANKEKIKIAANCERPMSFDEYCATNLSKILEQHEQEKNDAKMAKQRANLEVEKLKQEQAKKEKLAKIEAEKMNDESDQKKKEALEMLKSALLILNQVQDNQNAKVHFDDIFVIVGEHLEIASIIRTSLKFIDLTGVKFDNVDVHGVDFRECNLGILFNPQKVYNKDLRGCNFDKVYISPFMNFSGVDIRGCCFSDDEDSRTIDVFNATFRYAIYDETTTYNGIPFTKIFEETDKKSTSRIVS